MIRVEKVDSIRPSLLEEIGIDKEFTPRTEAIQTAYEWGKSIHAGQKRLSGEPYFETHCVWIAAFLDKLVSNEAWTIAALLHDCVEDRCGSFDDIRKKFPGRLGEDIAYIVDGVTKLSTPHDGQSRELETLRKLASYRDPGVYLVKLADKTHNIMTLEYMSSEKRIKKAEEAIRAYGKLAGILNCYKWRRWLEDMAFPHADPQTYQYVKDKIDSDPRMQSSFINHMMEQLASILGARGIAGRVEIIVNGYWQLWQKLRRMAQARKTSLDSFAAVNDVVSFRMLVDSNDEEACYALLPAINRYLGVYLDHNRFDDYIACPQNGYRALQITAWLPDYGAIEVAIATTEMEDENHWGVVHAIRQKKDLSAYRPMAILTPTGGVRFLPDGSTVLDAVASIQQEFLLDKISAVKVNNNLAKLSELVKPGDVIEVVTSGPRLKPNEEWLNYCNEQTARLLRVVLITESLRTAAEKGREMIKPLLATQGIADLRDVQVLEKDRVDNLLERLACVSLEDLYAAIGGGAIRLSDVAAALEETHITRQELGWVTVYFVATSQSNKPGVLSRLAGLASNQGANIIRSVTDTLPDGGFALRLVLKNLPPEKIETLADSYKNCNIECKTFELLA
ncbi:MAG: bifunctional (p)ppGpp synthetase/guanosine-3',5'-bis(diphosphate) 3'-pyrophosphohydrolase [Anaerolineae bacterium]|nr:bifunctional (p)ppGpp synthetase/guanosine-3',5'-bis(diphosphate) 3'-pyrophosphohydrolase [Anaerolineae bacterium]